MTTNINADDGVVSGVAGLKTSADNSGVLALQTNGTTALTVNASQALGVGSTPSYGTSGQVLSSSGSSASPTWVTPSAGAMTLISTATASSSATIDFTGLTSAYKNYVVIAVNVVPATNNAGLNFRTSTNNGVSYDSGANNYYSTHTNFGESTWNYGNYSDNTFNISFYGQDNTATYGGTSFTMTIVNPSASNRIQWYMTGFENGFSGQTGAFVGGGFRFSTTGAVNAIRFYFSSGNIASGTFKLYGIS